MKTLALALAVLALAVAPLGAAPPATPDLGHVLNATFYLQEVHEDFSCSATAIAQDSQTTLFLTARHCVTDRDTGRVYSVEVSQNINGPFVPVKIVQVGKGAQDDWAVVAGPVIPNIETIPLATNDSPYIGQKIIVAGYPYGLGPVATEGKVNGINVWGSMFSVFVYGAPGNSGSAVVSEDTHTIIGIISAAVEGGGYPLILVYPASLIH